MTAQHEETQMSAELNELAARVEALSGPDRRVDAAIALACVPEFVGWIEHLANNGNQWGEIAPSREAFDEWLIHDGEPCLVGSLAYTASLDAAMTLADPSWWLRINGPLSEAACGYSREDERQIRASFDMLESPYSVGARSTGTDPIGQIARAVTAAALRSKAASQ